MTNSQLHIVHTESSGGWGGQEIRILSESVEFIKQGHRVTLISDYDTPIAHRAKQYKIPTVELPIGKKNIWGLFALRKWISQNEFDIINTHSSSDSWMVAIGMRLSSKRKPLVRTRHVSAAVSNNKATQWLYQTASDYIVTTGEKLRQTLINDNNIKPERIRSVPTGIDCRLFTPSNNKTEQRSLLNLPQDKTIIGIVATLRSWKGHRYLIDAFAKLQSNEHHLLIVGNGPQWDNINQQIDQLNIRDSVTLCGDQQNVTPWLQAMDIFALPSYANEGVPQSLMQAMACGLPVISTDTGSITEIVNNDTGLIICKENVDALVNAIQLLSNDEVRRQSLANNALQFAQSSCGIEKMTHDMLSVFNLLIE